MGSRVVSQPVTLPRDNYPCLLDAVDLDVSTKEHVQLAREIASNATVLLRNANDTLPLATSSRKIAVLGINGTVRCKGLVLLSTTTGFR